MSGNTLPWRLSPNLKAYLALVAVCFFWGTTYLGIRMALESFPPLALVAIRFTCSGTLMLVGAAAAGARLPKGRELAISIATGILVLGVGNGCLTFAELWIPSGLAALIISFSPFWMVGIEALMPGGEPLHRPTAIGMLVGCAGAVLLLSSDLGGGHRFGPALIQGFLLLQFGSASWAFGSLYQRRRLSQAHPIVTGAVQQLAAGLAFAIPALLVKEHPVEPAFRGMAAICYLIVFGSIVGYSAYVYALAHLPVAVASIYSYINPLVAVLLGWLFYREPFGRREAVAVAVIFTGVAIVKRWASLVGRTPSSAPDPLVRQRPTGASAAVQGDRPTL